MATLVEKRLTFDFGSSWSIIIKYDEDGRYYRTQLAKSLEATRAVDFLGCQAARPLLMLEVKDFSLGVPNQAKFDSVPTIVAEKIRDTLAGMIGGSIAANGPEKKEFQGFCRKLSQPPGVVYLFEDLNTPDRRPPQRKMSQRNLLHKLLKRKLRWLTNDVVVAGLDNYQDAIEDLTIRTV